MKDRLNALKNPYAHLHQADITLETGGSVADAVGPDPLRRDVPVVRRRVRDGAGESETAAERAPRPPAWIHGVGDAQRADDVLRAATR